MIEMQGQKLINRTGAFVAASLILLYGFALWSVSFHPIPDASREILLVLIGALSTNITGICQFFFGGSAPSRTKDSTIQTLATTQAKAQDNLDRKPEGAI
jgi:hypothetical protein